ncbi:hypothetical protein L596_005688 [Steinernema carpocapsae]|uniref:Ubiquitin-like modifier-activating enzyme ATG7 n=1 Tax=Steinernema carpocapsae TaxID=34508 RepID=A0A4U8V129_STECR|nr:hypothetical protein L596_005688 [Steinernema carpocapsae]
MASTATFLPFTTVIHNSFWDTLGHRKLNEWKLDESPRTVWAQAAQYRASQRESCHLQLDHSSYFAPSSDQIRAGVINISGTMIVYNTAEAFQSPDRKALLANEAALIWESVTSNGWTKNPHLLNSFVLTVFADLKKQIFYHWNCVPALIYPNEVGVTEVFAPVEDKSIQELIGHTFLENGNQPFLVVGGKAQPLTEIANAKEAVLAYPDYATEAEFSWNLRNLIAAVAYTRKDLMSIEILTCRGMNGVKRGRICWTRPASVETPTAVGWERNDSGQLTCKKTVMPKVDQSARADQMIDLNLKLISWRLVPDIKLEKYTDARCLLLGSGTLGCNIARALMGWGVKNFTFVDNSTVSMSNAVRQSLYTFQDGVEGKSKAHAAAEAVKRIRPTVVAQGANMMIPMPGHPISPAEVEKTQETVKHLDDLIKAHDVIFLLMDSREARWLPTLLSSMHNKLCFTVGLGFHTFVAMRHGGDPGVHQQQEENLHDLSLAIPGSQLACYFCTDIVAPVNSMRDRTLDQQCTVTRAGMSFIATGVAVEMFASVVQHPLGIDAPAEVGNQDDNSTVLGATPHQIRGSVNGFKQMTPAVRRNTQCTACSSVVKQKYLEDGWTFLEKVFNEPKYLEDITGLTQLHISAEEGNDQIIAYDDDESV